MSTTSDDPPEQDTAELDVAAVRGPVRLKVALPALKSALENPQGDATSRRQVVRQLAAYGGAEVTEILAAGAAAPGNTDILASIVRAFGYVHDPTAVAVVAPYVRHPVAGVAGAAVKALMALDGEAASREVADVLIHGSNAQAREVARVMGERFPKESGKVGRALLAGRSPKSRLAAHLLWRYITDESGRSHAIHALRMERDPAVFEAALGLLLRASTPQQRPKVERFRDELARKVAVLDKLVATGRPDTTAEVDTIPDDTAAVLDRPQISPAAIGSDPGVRSSTSGLSDPQPHPAAEAGARGVGGGAQATDSLGAGPAWTESAHTSTNTDATPTVQDATVARGPTPVAPTAPLHPLPALPTPAGIDRPRVRTGQTRPQPAAEKVPAAATTSPWREVLTRPMVITGFVMVAICYGLSVLGVWPGADTGVPAPHASPELTTSAIGKVGQKIAFTGELAEANGASGTLLILLRDKGMLVAASFKDQPVGHFQVGRPVTVTGKLLEVKSPKVAIVEGITVTQ